MREQQNLQNWNNRYFLFVISLIAIIFLASSVNAEEGKEKSWFISAANNCKNIELTLTEEVGVIKYSSSDKCVFNKTLVSLDINESDVMKNILEGKSLTCSYEKGKFDQRLVSSLIFGIENCEGGLRDVLGQLILFAEPEQTKKPTMFQNIMAIATIALLGYAIFVSVRYMRKKYKKCEKRAGR